MITSLEPRASKSFRSLLYGTKPGRSPRGDWRNLGTLQSVPVQVVDLEVGRRVTDRTGRICGTGALLGDHRAWAEPGSQATNLVSAIESATGGKRRKLSSSKLGKSRRGERCFGDGDGRQQAGRRLGDVLLADVAPSSPAASTAQGSSILSRQRASFFRENAGLAGPNEWQVCGIIRQKVDWTVICQGFASRRRPASEGVKST